MVTDVHLQRKIVNNFREEADTPEKIYSAIDKLLSSKDQLVCQFLRILLFKKNILWRDLNIIYDDYIHGEVKTVLNLMKSYEDKYGYIPSSLEFKMPKTEEIEESSLPDLISITLTDFNEMIESIKNYSKLNGN